MIAGGIAAIVYGEPRLTQDIEVVVGLRPGDAQRVAAQFPEPAFYCAPVEVIAEEAGGDAHGHFNLLPRVPPEVVLLSKLNPEIERVWLVDATSPVFQSAAR